MIQDMVRRLNTILGSVVLLATGLSALAGSFVTQVTPALPAGWQDNATQIGAVVVSVLVATAAAARRLTEVDKGERGLLPSAGRNHVPPS